MKPQDRWHKTTPGPLCRKCNVRREVTADHGRGLRWLAVWPDAAATSGRARQSFDTKDAAQAKLDEMADTIRSGRYVAANAGRILFRDLADEWLAGRAALKESSADKYQQDLRLHVFPVIGDRRLTEIDGPTIQRLINGLRSTKGSGTDKLADNSKRGIAMMLGTIFSYAVKTHKLAYDANPCLEIEVPRKPVKVSKFLPTTAQTVRIAGEMPARSAAIVHLATASGMRISELVGLTRDRLTFHEDGTMTVRVEQQLSRKGTKAKPMFGTPKTTTSIRPIRVEAATAAIIQRHLMTFGIADGLVFRTRTGGQYRQNQASRDLNLAVAAVGLGGADTPVTWHTFRHYHVSYLVSMGVSITAISKRLGHKDVATTLNEYTWLWHSDESDVLAALAARTAPVTPGLRLVAGATPVEPPAVASPQVRGL